MARGWQTPIPGGTGADHARREQGSRSGQSWAEDTAPRGQNPEAVETERPFPDIAALMHQVEQNQRRSESLEKTYLYRSVVTQQEFDPHGQVKKITTIESDHFWLNGVPVSRVVRRNGKDLTAEEVAKENERIEKETRRDRERRDKKEAAGKETDPQGHEEITVSRFLSLGAFSNPRRVALNGRATIAVDYTGDPHARTHNRAEDAVRDMAGTVWVDEQDKVLARVEGRFVNAFKIGGGLVADIRKDTRFEFQQEKVNEEVWLPAHIHARGAMRALLLYSFSGQVEIVDSDYRKFRATATVLPDITPAPQANPEPAPASTASPTH
ncbi:MAG: hypothetical protein NVSMB62_01700 [Acidobacteriaceae bacterium]